MSNWRTLYNAALTETDRPRLSGRIEAAKRAIYQRLEELDETDRERDQLDGALHALFTLPGRKRTA